jgi:hypothetical protein
MNWPQVHVWLNGAGASLEGWIGVLSATLGAAVHQMRWPTSQGWISIVGVFLNALGVLVLSYFRLEGIGGWQTTQSAFELRARNLRRIRRRYVGFGLIWVSVALQVVAQLFPDAAPPSPH